MRMTVDAFVHDSTSMGAPGVDEVKWLKPLRPGMHITLRTTVLEIRTSKSRPEMGFVKVLMEVLDDEGGRIMTLTTSMLMGRRVAAEVAPS
jgi:acyl dehydratase